MLRVVFVFLVVSFASVWACGLSSAKELFGAKDYAACHSKLSHSSCAESLEANLLLGVCSFNLKKYYDSISAFDRALMLDPSNKVARVYTVLIHSINGNDELASKEAGDLLREDLAPNLKKTLLGIIKKTHKPKLEFFGLVGANAGYDSNYANANDEKNFKILGYLHYKGKKSVPSAFYSASGLLGLTYKRSERLYLGALMHALLKDYTKKEADKNLQVFSFALNPKYILDTQLLYSDLSFSKAYLRHAPYLNAASADFGWKKYFTKHFNMNLALKLESKVYEENGDSSFSYGVSYALSYPVLGIEAPLLLGLNLELERQEGEKHHADTNHRQFKCGASLQKQFTKEAHFASSASYTRQDFMHENLLFGTKRKDGELRLAQSLSYLIATNANLTADVIFVSNSSNQAYYSYKKFVTSLGINYYF